MLENFELKYYMELNPELKDKFFRTYAGIMNPGPEEIAYLDYVERFLNFPKTMAAAIVKGNELCGFVIVGGKHEFGKLIGFEISGIYVNPQYRAEFRQKFNSPMFPFLNGLAAKYAEEKDLALHASKMTPAGAKAYKKMKEREESQNK